MKQISKKQVDEVWAKLSPEDKAEAKAKCDFLIQVIPSVMMTRAAGGKAPSMNVAMELEAYATEYMERYKCSIMDFKKDYDEVEAAFMHNSITKMGTSFGDCHNVPSHLQKKNMKNARRIDKQEQQRTKDREYKNNNPTRTIGDLLKAKDKK